MIRIRSGPCGVLLPEADETYAPVEMRLAPEHGTASVIEAFMSAEGMPPEPADVRRLLVATGQPQAEGVVEPVFDEIPLCSRAVAR